MKKSLSTLLCMIVLLQIAVLFCSCRNETGANDTEMTTFSFYEMDRISVDKDLGRATYTDGIVTYSWSIDKWLFEIKNGIPVLNMKLNDTTVGFCVLADNAGVADNFWLYARNGLMDIYDLQSNDVDTHMFEAEEDSFFTGKGYFGLRTGFNDTDINRKDNQVRFNFAIVHAITNGKNSALVCIYANDRRNEINSIKSTVFANDEFHPYLEELASDITASFEFVSADEDSNEELKEKEYFSYTDAYEMFKDVYSWNSHAGYIEFVDNEANKMKNEVEKVNAEIMELMKDKYQDVSDYPPERSYSDYYKTFILPYEKYYYSRMEAAENVQSAYLGISEVLTYGGNAGGDCSMLWKYAHYRNLYNELCDLRDFIR